MPPNTNRNDEDPQLGFSPTAPAPRPAGIKYEPYVGAPPPASPGAQAMNDLPFQAAAAGAQAVATGAQRVATDRVRPAGFIPSEPYVGAPPPASPAALAMDAAPIDAAVAVGNAIGGKKPVRAVAVTGPANPALGAAQILERANPTMGVPPTAAAPRPAFPTGAQVANAAGAAGSAVAQGAVGFAPETAAVYQGGADDVMTRGRAGDVTGAAGAAVRTVAGSVPAFATDLYNRTVAPAVRAAKGFYAGLTGDSPGTAMAAPIPPSAQQAGAAAQGAAPGAVAPGMATMGESRLPLAPGAQPAAQPVPAAVAAPATSAVPGAAGVTKIVGPDGKVTYTNVATDAGFSPNAGHPSAATDRVAQALSDRYAGESAAINARGEPQPTGPQMQVIEARPFGFKSDAERFANDLPFNTKGMSAQQIAQAATQLATNRESNETARANAQLSANVSREGQSQQARQAAARLALDASGQAVTNAEKLTQTQLLKAQGESAAQLNTAKLAYGEALQSGDSKRVATAEAGLRAAQGKWERDTSRYVPVAGGTSIDPGTGQVLHQPSAVFDSSTGEFRYAQPGAAAPAAAQSLPANKENLTKGTVYNTARGLATWDGSKFIPK